MTLFETDGFLSDQIVEAEGEITSRYQAAFDIATQANQLTHQVLFSAEVHNEDGLELLYVTLLTKQARSFQAFMLLLKRGLLSPAQIILRNLAENMFIVGALSKDETFAERYVLSEQVSRKKSLAALARDAQQRGQEVAQDIRDLIEQLDKQIKEEKIVTFRTEQIAQIAGLSSYYDSLYRFTSMEVHTSPRSLEDAFVVEESKIVSLRYEPETEGLDMYLHYAISAMLYALHEYSQHFKLSVDAIEALQKTNNEVGEASQEQGTKAATEAAMSSPPMP